MADFSSTKRNSSFEEWFEQYQSIAELNGYNPDFLDEDEAFQAYESMKQVADAFYDNFDVED